MLPVRIKEGIFLPVLVIALVGSKQALHVIHINHFTIEGLVQLSNELVESSDCRYVVTI